MHEKMHEIMKIRTKGGINGLTGLEGEKPCKNLGRKRQKNFVLPCQVEEREKSLKKI